MEATNVSIIEAMTPKDLKPGDVLLYHGESLIGKFIAWMTSSKYCHAAMIGPDGHVLEMYYLLRRKSGRESTVDRHRQYKIDVFRCRDADRAFWASIYMFKAIREKYSILHAIGAGLAFMIRPTQKECNKHGLHCSQAVSMAYRIAGLDPWLGGADKCTAPEHLARSPIFENLGPLEF